MLLPMYPFIIITLILTGLLNLVLADICSTKAKIFDDFEISCYKSGTVFKLKIYCKTENQWSNFPSEKLGARASNVIFENCTFPSNLSLLNVITSIGVRNIKTLKFISSSSILRREHLKDLVVETLDFNYTNFTGLLPSDLLYDIKLDKLYIDDSGVTEIPEDFFRNSSNLTFLEIFNNKILKLKSSDFAELINLTDLILYGNGITEIEAGTFDKLINLSVLDISKNRLRSLPSKIFKNLAYLTVINLTENDFDELAADTLWIENSCLRKVRLNHNRGRLSSLPNEFFRNLRFLEYAELTSNNFTSLPADLFLDAQSLTSLNISNNSLVILPRQLFNTTIKLKELWLMENLLESLPEGLFEETNLERLYLNYNRLTNLSKGVLTGLRNLKIFKASHNNLSHIYYELHECMSNVEVVDLSYNRLTLSNPNTPRISIFRHCVGLTHLNLAFNEVSQIFIDIVVGNLQYLNLTSNKITQLTAPDLSSFANDIVVDLRNNKISTIDFTLLSNEVEKHPDNPPKNVQIHLGGNPLNCDCKLLHFRRYLDKSTDHFYQFINILDTNLTCSAPSKWQNISVSTVDPSELSCLIPREACNEICPCWDIPDRKILYVDCSYKNLTTIPRISNPNNRSIELLLNNNDFKSTPSLDRADLLRVATLDLSSNNISTISLTVFSLSLQDLKLHNNSISRLNSEIVEYLDNDILLRNLTLHKNKWICDCEARGFLNVVQKKLTLSKLQEVMCSGSDRSLSSMTVNELCEDAIVLIVSGSILIAFFGVVVGSLAALYYRYQKEIKIWLYSKNWCLWFVTEDELDKDKQYDVFISYSHKDEDFVNTEIVAKLEEGPDPFKLCLHYRDWLPGEWIPAQIAHSVDKSRRTIVVLSPNFLESIWGRMEFRTAHNQALSDGRARVIVILYGHIGNTDDLDPELRAYLSTNTYVKWGDPWFWNKLRYALPHRYDARQRRARNARLIAKRMSYQPPAGCSHRANDNVEAIAMPGKANGMTNDSAKLLGSVVEDDRSNGTAL